MIGLCPLIWQISWWGLETFLQLLTWHLLHNSIKHSTTAHCLCRESVWSHCYALLCGLWALNTSRSTALQSLICVSCLVLIPKPILYPPVQLPSTEHKTLTDLRITPGFISKAAFFISVHQVTGHCFLISDGHDQYRLLNHQFLIVSQPLHPQGQRSFVFTPQCSLYLCKYTVHGGYTTNTVSAIGFLFVPCNPFSFLWYIQCLLSTHIIVMTWGLRHRCALSLRQCVRVSLWPHSVSSGLLLAASLCMSCTVLPPGDELCMCLCWLVLALRMNKVEHSVFMQVDEATLLICFWSGGAEGAVAFSVMHRASPWWEAIDRLVVIGHVDWTCKCYQYVCCQYQGP